MYKRLAILMLALFSFVSVSAQNWAIKTNLVGDATASINLGAEIGLAERWTLDLSGSYNPFTINKDTNMKWKHWFAQPEARYWFCHKFGGHFLAMHIFVGQYNVGNIDFLPDILIGGLIDDLSVVLYIIKSTRKELEFYNLYSKGRLLEQ